MRIFDMSSFDADQPIDWQALDECARAVADHKAKQERAIINQRPGLAVRLFEAEKGACGLPPSRELLAHLVKQSCRRAEGLVKLLHQRVK